MEQSLIGWGDFLKIVLTSGVVSAFVGQGLQWWRDARREAAKKQSDASFVAVQLVGELEVFALEVWGDVCWHERARAEWQYFENKEWCPVRVFQPATSRLEVLDSEIAAKIAWIGTEVDLALRSAAGTIEDVYDPELHADYRINLAGYFGYSATQLAEELRSKYHLPGLVPGWTLEGKKLLLKRYFDRSVKHLQ